MNPLAVGAHKDLCLLHLGVVHFGHSNEGENVIVYNTTRISGRVMRHCMFHTCVCVRERERGMWIMHYCISDM